MNRNGFRFILLTFGLSGLLGSCLKELELKPKLPPITCGAERSTFGCYVDENIFLPQGFNSFVVFYDIKNVSVKGTLEINAYRNTRREAVRIYLKNQVFDTGYYKLGFDDYSIGSVRYYNRNYPDPGVSYYCKEGMFGELHISHIDTVNRIVCGTFSFDAVSEQNNQDTVKIREGRFDTEFFY